MNKHNIEEFIITCEGLMISEDEIVMEGTDPGILGGVLVIALLAIGKSIRDYTRSKGNQSNRIINTKKKKEEQEEMKQTKNELETQFDQVHADIRKIVASLKKDKDLVPKINNILEKSELVDGYSKSDLKYRIISDIFEQYDDELIVEIIEADQMVTVELSFILKDIEKALGIKYPKLSFGTGDGDEGCIYVKGYLKDN